MADRPRMGSVSIVNGPVGGHGAGQMSDRVAAARRLLPRLQAGEDVAAEAAALIEVAQRAGDPEGECAALYSAMGAAAVRADSDRSRWAAERLVERGTEAGLPVWAATGRQYLARLHLAAGNEDIALRELVEAELLVDDLPPDVGLTVALSGIAVTYCRIGLHEDSERTYERLGEVVATVADRWSEHAFVYNRMLNQASWGVALAKAGFEEDAQARLSIAADQARAVTDLTGSPAYYDFRALVLFADLMVGEVGLADARTHLDATLEHALGEPQSYVRFAFAHQLSNARRWDEARFEVDAGLAAVNPYEQEPIRSALVWERARIAVLEHPDHLGVEDLWAYAQLTGRQVWELRRRRVEAAQEKLRVGRLKREHQRIERASLEDPLTGVGNRRRIDRERAALLSDATSGWDTVLYLDIDRFKAVNDSCGHEVGDAVLRELADLLRDNVRENDLVGRYGGDEFVVLARHSTPDDAARLSDRILAAVRAHHWGRLRPGLDIRVSLGVAATRVRRSELFPAADAALYRAKHGGRDRAELTILDASNGEAPGPVLAPAGPPAEPVGSSSG